MVSPIPLVSFLITFLLASAVCIQGVLVNDTDGNPVTTTDRYFIQPANSDVGLSPFPTFFSFCPLRIAVLPSISGPPVSFSLIPPWSKKTVVDTYSDVTIEYKPNYWLICSRSSKVWTFEASSSASEEPAVLIGGTPTRTNSWFKIRTAGANTYVLGTKSGTVGFIPVYLHVVPRRLVLTNDTDRTLYVKFKKVDVPTSAAY